MTKPNDLYNPNVMTDYEALRRKVAKSYADQWFEHDPSYRNRKALADHIEKAMRYLHETNMKLGKLGGREVNR